MHKKQAKDFYESHFDKNEDYDSLIKFLLGSYIIGGILLLIGCSILWGIGGFFCGLGSFIVLAGGSLFVFGSEELENEFDFLKNFEE